MTRGTGLLLSTLLAAVVVLPQPGRGEDWPTKPIRIIESLPAGVARDTRTRVVAEKLSVVLGQQVIDENRPGAAGRIAGLAAAQSSPDGYTFIMMGTTESCITRHLFNLGYDIERDFEPVSMIERLPIAVVIRASLPVKTLPELVSYARSHPGELTYGSTGTGLYLHLNGLLFTKTTHIEMRHIPYAQGSPFTDLLGGHIDMVVDALPPTLENIKAGHLRAVAVTGERRVASLPDVPTFVEAGIPSYDTVGFYGLLAPKGTSSWIVGRMQTAILQVLRDPALRRRWENEGGTPTGSSPGEFAAVIARESERWGNVIRTNNIKVD